MIQAACVMRAEAEMNYDKRSEREYSKLIKEIDSAIKAAVKNGEYSAHIYNTDRFTSKSILMAEDKLKGLDYKVYNLGSALRISWNGDSP